MNKKNVLFLVLCLVLLILAALPRSIELISHNYVFGYDQGKHWLAAQSIVVDHKFPLIGDEVGGRGGFFQGSGWFYVLAIPYFFFHGDPYGSIVLIFGVSMAMIALFMILFTPLIGKRESLAGAFFISLAPILISNSRFAWPPFMVPFLTVIYLWFVYLIFQKKLNSFFGMFFVIGLMAHFEIATAGTMFIATFLFFSLWCIKNKISLKYVGLGLIGFAIPLLPLLFFDIRHDFLNTKGVLSTLHGAKRYVGTWDEYFKIVSNHWMIFSDEFFRAFQMTYITKTIMVAFISIGSLLFLTDKKLSPIKRTFVFFLTVLPILLFSVFLLYKDDLWPWWISQLTVVYTVLTGIICVFLWKKNLISRIVVVILICSMTVSYAGKVMNSFSKELDDYGGVHKIAGKEDALDVIFTDAKEEKFGLLVFTPPIYTYAYDFLISWYGQKKYGYTPTKDKKNLFYLLIEPDTGQPWRHKGWIETVIKDGTVEKTWNLPSGFIIEKRRIVQ